MFRTTIQGHITLHIGPASPGLHISHYRLDIDCHQVHFYHLSHDQFKIAHFSNEFEKLVIDG
jgi:hypothetical protein